jgi:LysM repeat protein
MLRLSYILFLLLFSHSLFAIAPDSIGIYTKNGKKYIAHKAEQGEGLFAVARRYNKHVDEIRAANDNIESLALGQVLLIPYEEDDEQPITLFHTVQKQETLYSISKRYEVSVAEIRKWNDLPDNSIQIGQKLKIMKKRPEEESPKVIPAQTQAEEKVEEVQKQEADKTESVPEEPPASVSENEIFEEGVAGWIENSSYKARKSLALHHSAPAGTIIRVTNMLNNKTVFVKVVGELPKDDEHPKMIIKLSEFAASSIDANDKYTRVQLYYLKDPSLGK